MAERKDGAEPAAGERPKINTRNRKAPVVVKKTPATEGLRPDRSEGRGDRGGPARGGRVGNGRPEPEREPRFVGGPRNEHGTRVARRVTCTKCGTSDHVPFVPRDQTKVLCRSCAAEVLKTYELGVKVRTPTKLTTCNLCGTPFDLPVTVEDDGDPLCPSCLRGFTSWQGSVDVPFAERKEVTVEERLSGALVRKRKK